MADPKTTPQETDDTRIDAPVESETAQADESVVDADIVEDDDAPDAPAAPEPEPARQPDPSPQPRRAPGFVPLVLGGVVAAGLGYGAAFLGFVPSAQEDSTTADTLAAVQETLSEQAAALGALTDRTEALGGQIADLPPAPDPVDLTPISDRISALGARIDANDARISGLIDRIAYLETLPLGEGATGADNSAAVAAAVAQLQAAMDEQSAALAEQQAANAALVEQLTAAAETAEARIAAAEARAESRVAAATAQAALGQLRIAVATGAPFAGALADVADGTNVDVPEALATAAETGVPTLEELQSTFPAAARAALPVAIRETAGEGAMNRVTAFLQSQVGGRSLEPQDGDSADAVLSRAEAALRAGDLPGVIAELSALPEEAQAIMADWTASAQTRIAALEAMDAFAAALDAAN